MGGSHETPEAKMQVTEQEMRDARVPLEWRDYCAHLLIPLNKCRRKNFYMPFRCVDERHTYEKCQYEHYMRRVAEMDAIVRKERAEAMRIRDEKEAAELK